MLILAERGGAAVGLLTELALPDLSRTTSRTNINSSNRIPQLSKRLGLIAIAVNLGVPRP